MIPGFDRRFGWSLVPFELVIVSDLVIFLSYLLCFLTFKENSYAGRIIEVEKGQKIISAGPYSVIRHPMYLGMICMYIVTPLAFGSYWALPIFLLILPLIILRILNEEVLKCDLSGYLEYCKKTHYRLIPTIW